MVYSPGFLKLSNSFFIIELPYVARARQRQLMYYSYLKRCKYRRPLNTCYSLYEAPATSNRAFRAELSSPGFIVTCILQTRFLER